jgi:maltose O-acetyltransferase
MGLSERAKMLRGELYRGDDPELAGDRRRCQSLLRAFNDEADEGARSALLLQLLGRVGERTEIQPPFLCDYGYNVSLGADAFVNYGAVFLDVAPIVIGDQVQIATAVQVLTADHPRDPALRRSGVESGSPIAIEENAWIGGGAILCPGVTVGRDSIVGAGSVVTRAVPAGVVAAGNPCRVIREL